MAQQRRKVHGPTAYRAGTQRARHLRPFRPKRGTQLTMSSACTPLSFRVFILGKVCHKTATPMTTCHRRRRERRRAIIAASPIAESRRAVFARHRANEANAHQATHGNAGRGLLPSGGTAHAPQRIPNTREAGRRAARLYKCAPFSHCSCPSGSPCCDTQACPASHL